MTLFVNNKGETQALKEMLKPHTQNNLIGKDPTKGMKPTKEVNLAIRGGATKKK